MGTQELVSHCIITHQTHMDDMEWFSSIIFGDMPPNSISLDLAMWCTCNLNKILVRCCQIN
jgi:hypothetical protein